MKQSLPRGLALLFLFVLATASSAAECKLTRGDHICLVGNALGERMQHHNYWETLLYQRFPKHNLVVRNLCFPGDEPLQRLRSLNFGSPDDHLKHSKASVILFFFGFNESFQGHKGLKGFTEDLTRLIQETKKKNYSGKGPPRMVLISPIAFENTGDNNLPDGTEHNKRLEMYTQAMGRVAREQKVGFADLFTPTRKLFASSKTRWTLNGAHLNARGYQALAPMLDHALFGQAGAPTSFSARLKVEIEDKNFHWWHRYRAVNGYSIYGTRGKAGFDGTYRNRDVMERERAILDQMCANRDRRIWAVAQGQKVSAKVDDSNTLPFINPKTNVTPRKVPKQQKGKLGSLEYLSAKEQQKYFQLAPGYAINLVASEEQFPELANPVALNFDNKGRLWVSVMPSYPQWKPKTKLDDKLLILEDTNGDGQADRCKVFADGLHQPTGFEMGRGGVFVAQQPDVLFLKDTDGDDRADVRIRRLVGFDTADSHHGLAAFEWGPGGGLYFQEGTFKQSQLETPYGPVRLSDAGVWRYDPRREHLGVHVSLALANPWGHVFDRWGQNFIADASPGFNYWATPISGHVAYPDKHPGGCRDGHLDWGGSKSNKRYPTFIRKRIRPSSGCEIVSSRHFPPEAQGNFLLNNVIGDLAVLQHTIREEGSGFTGKEITPLVKCLHGNFRPVDLQFGPDGALYIVDWHNALIGHLQHNLRDPNRDHSHGRIWRVTYTKRPLLTPQKINGQPIAKLLDLLKVYEDRTRYRVKRELAERDSTEVVAALKRWVGQLDTSAKEYQHHLLEALWVYQTHNHIAEGLLKRVLSSPDYRARAAGTRVLSYWHERVPNALELLRKQINDKHPRVRLEAVRACSFIHSPRSLELVLEVLNHPMDGYLEYTLDETIRALEHALVGSSTHAGHQHGKSGQPGPLVFLGKSPKVVQFQLNRLAPSQLVLIKRSPDDAKYKPVYQAIVGQAGVSRQDREEAIKALARLNGSTPAKEVFAALERIQGSAKRSQGVVNQLAVVLLNQPAKTLAGDIKEFRQHTKAKSEAARALAYAALIAAGNTESAWKSAKQSPQQLRAFLAGVSFVPNESTRAQLRDEVVSCLAKTQPLAVRREAVRALAHVPAQPSQNFRLVAPLVGSGKLRQVAVQTLLSIPAASRSAVESRKVVETLVRLAESTPAARRTTDPFLNAMHLVDELLPRLPVKEAQAFRDRLRKVVVRVIRINTVQEEMRYDTPYFVVEADRPVQVVLRNRDLMPHNLVITRPGKLRDVAQQAAGLPPTPDRQGRQYIPKTKDVLWATRPVEPNRQDVLTFTAPSKPGEYPYVCTFPNHWMRMYGVMVVVKDLDAWLASPKAPPDPLGITRKVVKQWTLADFPTDLNPVLEGRQPRIGRMIFEEATCLKCHKIHKEGGEIGPDLTEVFKRWKGDARAVLRSIVEPSHTIEEQYAAYNVITTKGQILSGIVTKQDRSSITIITNPEKPIPQVIKRRHIDEMTKSSVSTMPKGLLDRFTRDEIYELLAYLKSGKPAK